MSPLIAMRSVWKSRLGGVEKAILCAWCDHIAEHDDTAFPSIRRLVEKTSFSRTAVTDALRTLRQSGVLVLVKRTRTKLILRLDSAALSSYSPTTQEIRQADVSRDPPGGHQDVRQADIKTSARRTQKRTVEEATEKNPSEPPHEQQPGGTPRTPEPDRWTVWLEAWDELMPGAAYPAGSRADTRALRELEDLAGGDLERLGRGVRTYLRAEAVGRVWPHGEGASPAKMRRQGPQWMTDWPPARKAAAVAGDELVDEVLAAETWALLSADVQERRIAAAAVSLGDLANFVDAATFRTLAEQIAASEHQATGP